MATQVERVSNLDTSGAFRYQVEIDVNSNSTHAVIIRLAGKGKRVLELGCATGHMSRVLRDRGCRVTAVELDALAAERARVFCENVIVGDLDQLNLEEELGDERFDVVIAADVLEHLKDPAAVLRSVKNLLRPDGCVIVSIPNVAHISVRLALLAGRFRYRETGLLDRTHLRFFTRESVEALFDDAGIAIAHFHRNETIPANPAAFDVPYDPTAVPPEVLDALSRDPEAATYQFVVMGYPLPRAGLVFIQDRMKDLAFDLEAARREAADLRARLEESGKAHARDIAEASQCSQQLVMELELQLEQARQSHAREVAEAAQRDQEAMSTRESEMQDSLEAARAESAALRRTSEEQRAEAEVLIASLRERNDRMQEEVQELSSALEMARDEAAALRRTSEEQRAEAERLMASLREQNGRMREETQELSSGLEAARREAAALRQTSEEQKRRIAQLEAKQEALFAREKELRDMLFDAHDQLLRRDEEIAATVSSVLPAASSLPATPAAPPGAYLPYQQLQQQIRELVRQAAPQGGNVLVISKGDDDLLRLPPCRGMHFPQREDGGYTGYHPADDETAITHLNELRERGAQFLLIPETSLWWLTYYSRFAEHLDSRFKRAISLPGVCVMFDLAAEKGAPPAENVAVAAAPAEDVVAVEASPAIVVEPQPRAFGVNLSGHITSEKGVGEGARATIRALRAAGIPVILNNFVDPSSRNVDAEFAQSSSDNPYSVNLLHMNPDQVQRLITERGGELFKDHYNIGYWAWELPRFPEKWISSFKHLDELWVPSNFVLDSIARSSPIPVIKAPHALTESLPLTSHGRSYFGLPEDRFVFLFMFDFMSTIERKNPLGLIEAFRKAFKPREGAMLVLKGLHPESAPSALKMLERSARGLNVKFLDTVLGKAESNTLLNLCDCYVSLHRSEGFGLTLAEAMSLEKPVIATGYSGNMDFMTPANSFLANYNLVPLARDYDPYEKGSFWAEPDLNHAAELMRLVFEERDRAAKKGQMARRAILQHLTPSAVGHVLCERFARLGVLGKLSVPESLLEAARLQAAKAGESTLYRELIHEVRRAVEASTPAGATIAVVSRGDDELLRIDGRDAWHFPRQEDGAYAGYHPADSEAAIAHLESLRADGARFLIFPRTAFWWLDYYSAFRSHLESRQRPVWRDENCIIYRLSERRRRAAWAVRDRMRAWAGR